MKKRIVGLFLIILCISTAFVIPNNQYVLIKLEKQNVFGKMRNVAVINNKDINQLNEPLKALAAYYSTLAGSDCDRGTCELTTALGLGNQGSREHKEIITKWFNVNPVTEDRLKVNFFLPASGSSVFSDYAFLIFTVKNDTVCVKYEVNYYNHGKGSLKKGVDKILFSNNKLTILEQTL